MVNTVWVNADHGRDLHPLADHMTKLQNFTKEENHDKCNCHAMINVTVMLR